MKNFVSIAMLLILAAAAHAAVTVSCARVGATNDVEVNYTVTGPNSIRAFALDISVDSGAAITALSCSNSSYYIYPGSIQISGGSVSNYGICICNSTYPGTKGGLGTSAVTVEMGSLYTGTGKPASSGLLARFTVSAAPTTVTLTANTTRRGVVMEDPYESPGLTLTGCTLAADCLYVGRVFPATKGFAGLIVNSTHMARWNWLGKPNCWCCDSQKRGNGVYSGASACRVDTADLAAVRNTRAWMAFYTQTGYPPCSDVDFSGRIDTSDLSRIKSTNNWMQTVGCGPPCE